MIELALVAIVFGSIVGACLTLPGGLELYRNGGGIKNYLKLLAMGQIALVAIMVMVCTLGSWSAIAAATVFGLFFGIIFGCAAKN